MTPRDIILRDLPRVDLKIVADMVKDNARVLDVGCGDGALLHYLVHQKGVDGYGMEISQDGVNASVSLGLSVVQGDADTDLKIYPTSGFDYAILSQTLQATFDPRVVLRELVRVARHAIVSFPNFGYWQIRWNFLASGRMPVTDLLTYKWFESPNIHLCTLRDFVDLCEAEDVVIERAISIGHRGRPRAITLPPGRWANLMCEQFVCLLRRR